VLVAALLLGCGARTGAEVCQRTAAITCKKLFQCAPQAVQSFTNEADCTSKQASQLQCDGFANARCDFSTFDKCLSELDALPCTATATVPSSCTGISQTSFLCAAPSGSAVSCSDVRSSVTSGACTFTQSSCSDGKTYSVGCSGGTCSCSIDGVNTKSLAPTTFDFCANSAARAEAKAQCGWSAG
jgi:hypothetical protein